MRGFEMKATVLGNISRELILRSLPDLEESSLEEKPDVIFVRSESLHDEPLPESLFAICRAGTGVDNIPLDWCNKSGVVIFNAPGANANSVKELIVCILIASSRNLEHMYKRAHNRRDRDRKSFEENRGRLRGREISGKTLGIIGVGMIGTLVAGVAQDLGMNVLGYDPYAPEKNFRGARRASTIAELGECHFLTLHCEATDETRGMINAETLAQLRHGVTILNFGRDELVDKQALREALKSGLVSQYWTDFHDPDLYRAIPDGIMTFPHIGALTEEAEKRAQEMVARQLLNFWQTGAIENSVNFPAYQPEKQKQGALRLVVANLNVPNMIGRISGILGEAGYNISLNNKNRGSVGYTVIDIDNPDEKIREIIAKISGIKGTTKVRVII